MCDANALDNMLLERFIVTHEEVIKTSLYPLIDTVNMDGLAKMIYHVSWTVYAYGVRAMILHPCPICFSFGFF